MLVLDYQWNGLLLTRATLTAPQATYLAAPHPQILDLLERSRAQHRFVWGSESMAM